MREEIYIFKILLYLIKRILNSIRNFKKERCNMAKSALLADQSSGSILYSLYLVYTVVGKAVAIINRNQS